MLKHTLIALFIGLVSFIVYLMIHLGVWKNPEISMQDTKPRKLLAKNHLGAYHKINPIIQSVESFAKKFEVTCNETFGEYFDDPTSVSEDRLRSRGGCIVPFETDFINSKFSAADLKQEELELIELPPAKAVAAVFTGSPAIGPYKVYPKIDRYMQTHKLARKGSVMEVYKINSSTEMTTTYFVNVE
jgi:AraC family transcriptional regulator